MPDVLDEFQQSYAESDALLLLDQDIEFLFELTAALRNNDPALQRNRPQLIDERGHSATIRSRDRCCVCSHT